ncbi:uncharacterized protein [Ptychodera flava]|uniref:uncharacterized protein n=1 Tax=Ptychodera flava TaxID=63121 RepID=UPI003969F450
MRDNDYVDIYGIACEMRMHRMFMIQTESQYVFIHQCVSDLLHEEGGGGEDDFPPPPFDEHIYGNVPPMSVRQPDIVANHDMVEGGGNDGDGADENTVADSGEVHVELEGGNGDNFPPPPRDDQVYDDVPHFKEKPNSNTMGM